MARVLLTSGCVEVFSRQEKEKGLELRRPNQSSWKVPRRRIDNKKKEERKKKDGSKKKKTAKGGYWHTRGKLINPSRRKMLAGWDFRRKEGETKEGGGVF